MKTTLKTEFDMLGLSENELVPISEPDLDYEAIRKKVLLRTTGARKRSGFKRKLITTLAAAAVGLTIACTAVLANIGGVGAVFGDYFSVKTDDDLLYAGENIRIESSCDMNIEFLGITGDEETVYACVGISKKDNSPLTDIDFDNVYPQSVGFKYGPGSCTFLLSDDRRSMRMFIEYDHDKKDISNDRLQVYISGIDAYKKERLIMKGLSAEPKKFGDDAELARKKCEEMGVTLGNYHYYFNGKSYDCYEVERKRYPMIIDISFELKGFNPSGVFQTELGHAPDVISDRAQKRTMTISPFRIKLEADYTSEDPLSSYVSLLYEVDPERSSVIMNDGTRYSLLGMKGGGGGSTEYSYDSCYLYYKSKPLTAWDEEKTIIDTNSISEIIINGNTVYKRT